MTLIIVGLGPGDPNYLTLEAKAVLDQASEIYLRTAHHPTVAFLPAGKLHSFDSVYEAKATFEDVYATIVAEVLRLAHRPQGVVYAVPGHPLMGEATVRALLRDGPAQGIEVRVVSGLSFIEPVTALLGVDPMAEGLQIVDALDPWADPQRPVIVAQVYNRRVASNLKLSLLERYPEDWRLTVVQAAGTTEASVRETELAALDRDDRFDHLTCLYIPALSPVQDLRSFAGLQAIVARLRHPEQGCPWDRQQTHESLKGGLLEETYEVLAALDEGDMVKLREELGDLLLQVVMQTHIATEQSEFTMPEVILGITSKLIRRHPHVFGDVQVRGAEEVIANWAAIKQAERGEERPLLDSVVPNLPALAYSQELVERAARIGFAWPSLERVLEEATEKLRAFPHIAGLDERRRVFGDLLFLLVKTAHRLKIDAEEALRLAARRFYRRFTAMEEMARAQGKPLSGLSHDEMLALWQAAEGRQ